MSFLMDYIIRQSTKNDTKWIKSITHEWGGTDFIISLNRKLYPYKLGNLIAESNNGTRQGLLTYNLERNQCEIVLLEAIKKHSGIGTALIKNLVDILRPKSMSHIWVLTTNDNIDALRFYQKRGFVFDKIFKNVIEEQRKVKKIPKIGNYGIPIRDEISLIKDIS